ncbi:MAG: tetratricopeptide (TPR) repeat protein, partial [Woeseiaceae bacterium]
AVELDPRNGNTLGYLADTNLHLRNYAAAERYYARRLDIAPDNRLANLTQVLIPMLRDGDFTDLKAAVESQREMSFRDYHAWMVALYERDYDMALRYVGDWGVDVDDTPNGYVPIESYYGVTYALAGQSELAAPHFEAARTHVETALEEAPDDARLYVALGEALLGLGERDQAIRAAARAVELMPRSTDALIASWIQLDAIKRVLAPAGFNDVLIEQLDDYLTQNGWWSIEGLLPDPRFDPVRDDPRFQEIVGKHRRK